MGKVTDLEKVRNEKAPVCVFCGEAAHKAEYACPRIQSVTENPETGEVTVRFVRGFDVPSD